MDTGPWKDPDHQQLPKLPPKVKNSQHSHSKPFITYSSSPPHPSENLPAQTNNSARPNSLLSLFFLIASIISFAIGRALPEWIPPPKATPSSRHSRQRGSVFALSLLWSLSWPRSWKGSLWKVSEVAFACGECSFASLVVLCEVSGFPRAVCPGPSGWSWGHRSLHRWGYLLLLLVTDSTEEKLNYVLILWLLLWKSCLRKKEFWLRGEDRVQTWESVSPGR